jgi:hypothetical protein
VKWQYIVVFVVAGTFFDARADKIADCKGARERLKADIALIAHQHDLKAQTEALIRKCETEKSKGTVLSCEGDGDLALETVQMTLCGRPQ